VNHFGTVELTEGVHDLLFESDAPRARTTVTTAGSGSQHEGLVGQSAVHDLFRGEGRRGQ
jgi:hypothetical protein